MLYYKVKQAYDGFCIKHGRTLVANELYTPSEVTKYKVPATAVDAVEVSRRKTYWFFGARLESK